MRGTRTAHARLLAPVGATLLIAGAVALAAGPVVADTSAASRVARAAPFDLDGDGYGDLATGVPLRRPTTTTGPARSSVTSTGQGASAAANRLVGQTTAGVVGGERGTSTSSARR